MIFPRIPRKSHHCSWFRVLSSSNRLFKNLKGFAIVTNSKSYYETMGYSFLKACKQYAHLLLCAESHHPTSSLGFMLTSKDYPQPFWLALFVEGTRFTQAKLLATQEYVSSMGLLVPRNVLIPRTKVDVMAGEFTDINRGMEKTRTFTMKRKKLSQLVGKANSNFADVILKLGLFERFKKGHR